MKWKLALTLDWINQGVTEELKEKGKFRDIRLDATEVERFMHSQQVQLKVGYAYVVGRMERIIYSIYLVRVTRENIKVVVKWVSGCQSQFLGIYEVVPTENN